MLTLATGPLQWQTSRACSVAQWSWSYQSTLDTNCSLETIPASSRCFCTVSRSIEGLTTWAVPCWKLMYFPSLATLRQQVWSSLCRNWALVASTNQWTSWSWPYRSLQPWLALRFLLGWKWRCRRPVAELVSGCRLAWRLKRVVRCLWEIAWA